MANGLDRFNAMIYGLLPDDWAVGMPTQRKDGSWSVRAAANQGAGPAYAEGQGADLGSAFRDLADRIVHLGLPLRKAVDPN